MKDRDSNMRDQAADWWNRKSPTSTQIAGVRGRNILSASLVDSTSDSASRRGNAARDTGDEGGHAYLPRDVDKEPTYQSINRGRLENIKDAQLKEQQERRRLEEKIDKLTMMMEAQHGHRVQGDRDSTIRKKIPQSGLRENDGAGYPTNKGSFVDDETARKDLYFIMAMPVHSMGNFRNDS